MQGYCLTQSQFEVTFSDDHVSEFQAQSRIASNTPVNPDVIKDHESGFSDLATADNAKSDSPSHGKREKERVEYDILTLQDQRYLCRIPQVEAPTKDATNDTLSRQDEEKELARANERGWELLQGMQGNCIYFYSGWWSYRYCHGQGVKQFHQLPPSLGIPTYPPVEDPNVHPFILGQLDTGEAAEGEKGLQNGDKQKKTLEASKAVGTLETRGDQRYLVQRLSGGTECDLTGRERRIEVQVRDPCYLCPRSTYANIEFQFHCNPATSDRISLIKEVATCAYLMVIQTPRLCNDVAFMPPQVDSPNPITCSPILSHDEVPAYEAEVADAKAHAEIVEQIANPFGHPEEDNKHTAAGAAPTVVGGYTLGAHAYIPSTHTLEKSTIVGGGKETFIETIADSLGKTLTAETLKKYGLGDAKDVENLKKELEKIAKGKGWKLDVFDTPRGREYRGVVEDADEEEGKGKQGGEEKRDGGKGGEAGEAGEAGDIAGEGSEETYKDTPAKDEL